MQKLRLAGFISGAGFYIVLASPFHIGGPLHLREITSAVKLARQHRERAVGGTIAAIHHREEFLPIKGVCATYRAFPARARPGKKNDRSVARPAEHLLGGARDIGTCPDSHSAIHCHATGQSTHSSFSLGQTVGSLSSMADKYCTLHFLSHQCFMLSMYFPSTCWHRNDLVILHVVLNGH